MSKRPLLVTMLVLIVGCIAMVGGLYGCAQSNVKAAAPTQAAVMAAVTQEPTAIPEPTQDLQATRTVQEIDLTRAKADLAAMDAKIAETNRQIEQAKADAAQAAAMQAENEAKKAEQERLTVEAHNKQIELQIELQKQQNEQTRLQATVTQTENQKTALIIDSKKADSQRWYNLILIGVCVVGLVVGLIIAKAVNNYAQAITLQAAQPEPVRVTHLTDNPAPGYGTTRRISDPPGLTEKIQVWAVRALAGESIAVDPWETAETPFTKNEYRHGLYQWVMNNNLHMLNSNGERVLNPAGVRVVGEWLNNHPLPLQEISLENAPLPSVRTASVPTAAEGEAPDGEEAEK